METVIYLDTHVVVWLYATGTQKLSQAALDEIESTEDLRISPMVRLELQYLHEIERVNQPAIEVIDELENTIGLTICQASFPAIAKRAEAHNWTRDPFDRLIVAQAELFQAKLITKDQRIHDHYEYALW